MRIETAIVVSQEGLCHLSSLAKVSEPSFSDLFDKLAANCETNVPSDQQLCHEADFFQVRDLLLAAGFTGHMDFLLQKFASPELKERAVAIMIFRLSFPFSDSMYLFSSSVS
jgi:hypothetical protein